MNNNHFSVECALGFCKQTKHIYHAVQSPTLGEHHPEHGSGNSTERLAESEKSFLGKGIEAECDSTIANRSVKKII